MDKKGLKVVKKKIRIILRAVQATLSEYARSILCSPYLGGGFDYCYRFQGGEEYMPCSKLGVGGCPDLYIFCIFRL